MPTTMRVPDVFTRYRPAVDAGLRSALDEDSALFGMLRYHMGWTDESGVPIEANSGKAVRPALCLFSTESVGGSVEQALPAAVAIELIHNFSLVHDDIQDGDTQRRHRPTVWSLWGISHGLNAGAAMNVAANLAALDRPNGPSAETALRVSRILTHACAEMIAGQVLDVSFEQRPRVSVDDYLTMIGKKTGALLEAALHMGAVIGSDDEETIEAMRSLGQGLGLLFQVRDDMLGVWGKEEDTGKPKASDIHRRKKSLPIVYALNAAEGDSRERLRQIYDTDRPLTDDDVAEVFGVLDDLKADAFCRDLAETHAARNYQAVDSIEISPEARAECRELTQFLLERDY